MKPKNSLSKRIQEIMSDGMERRMTEIAKLARCRRGSANSAMLQLIEQGELYLRIDSRTQAKIYRFGSPPCAVTPGSGSMAEQQAVNAAFHAMVCAGRRDD
ncbi:hypothetical protein LJ656_33580 [Paraburkholderia sp. MMS20-SJTR3]|uniref:Uncharacterized protein n=1 Tax=Paraburkholderia sejongensis TaxID=2886946 RepID=A0ABS8K5W8_9BURK|nr:hypothetical protein [Paraburkholderia sp. MMS20-SJTR3]MCC8397488.1 hypothetical protein [Paraburkholderia sp. MMS20-SJTR3]